MSAPVNFRQTSELQGHALGTRERAESETVKYLSARVSILLIVRGQAGTGIPPEYALRRTMSAMINGSLSRCAEILSQ